MLFLHLSVDIEEVLEADGVDYVKPLQGITPARSMGQLLHGPLGTQCNIRRDTATQGTECTGNRVSTFFFGQLPPLLWLEFNSPETRETHSTKRLLDQKVVLLLLVVLVLPCCI